jgi:flagellin-like protein
MKEVKNKKGLSPVIASVFLILLVIILSAMVFLWARGFLSEQIEKFGEPVERQCEKVNFDAAKRGSTLEIANRGNINVFHFDIRMRRGGNTELKRFPLDVSAGEAESFDITLEMEDGKVPDEIIIYTALLGNVKGENSKKAFTCLDNGVML